MVDRAIYGTLTGNVRSVLQVDRNAFFIGDKNTFIRIMEDGADFSIVTDKEQTWKISGYFEYNISQGLVFYVEEMNLVSA